MCYVTNERQCCSSVALPAFATNRTINEVQFYGHITHTRAHYMLIDAHTQAHADTYMHTRARLRTYMYISTLTHTRARTNTHTRARAYTHIHTQAHAHSRARTHTRIRRKHFAAELRFFLKGEPKRRSLSCQELNDNTVPYRLRNSVP